MENIETTTNGASKMTHPRERMELIRERIRDAARSQTSRMNIDGTQFILDLIDRSTESIEREEQPKEARMIRAAAIDVYVERTSIEAGDKLMDKLGL
jgi:hypothetical protein